MFVEVIVSSLVLLATAASGAKSSDGLISSAQMTGLVGESVLLPCDINRQACLEIHTLKWYKGENRVFIFSEEAAVERTEGSLLSRTDFFYEANKSETHLQIFPLRTSDEGMYRCDLTAYNMTQGCVMVQFINLTMQAIPKYPELSFEDGSPIENGTQVGPFDEGTVLILVCEAAGGKPVAQVNWYNGTQLLEGKYTTTMDQDGIGTGKNTLRLPLTRADLGATLTCEVMNDAMDHPVTSSVTVFVNVPPQSVVVQGAESSLHEGDTVTLDCIVRGARPAASVRWLNGSREVQTPVNVEAEDVELMTIDYTYETKSRLQFEVTRFENDRTFTCEANNVVLENRKQEPMRREVVLDVLYAPIVRVSPENFTVKETMDVLIFCEYSANPPKLTHVNWYQDHRQVDVAGQPDKYGNGNVEHPMLLIKNSSASDMGEYTCRVSNDVGASLVLNSAFVSVLYRPQVQVLMDPMEPVSEEDRRNVTLICDIVKANPEDLERVRWYLDGELLKELPECDGNTSLYTSNSELCDIDPARLLLENVFKDFHGNYSCEGMNEAGWGLRSSDVELVVHYPPGPATITYDPPMVIKGQSLELTCNIEDPGRPAANTFLWYRGSHLVPDETSPSWTINSVSLETEDNFTCVPVNMEGKGDQATADIDVLAAPFFIDRLPPYYGALMSSERVSLACRVECSPLCSISWLKNGQPLRNDTHYTITSRVVPPDPSSGDLESVRSELTWLMDMWPDGVLDRERDNAIYNCTSTSNLAGPGDSSKTIFRVEYPPEEIVVSEIYVPVVEGEVPPKVNCNASSYPDPRYVWQHGGQAVSNGPMLNMDFPIKRSQAGVYQCIAENKHGEMKASTTVDVLFKPECKIDREDGGSGEDAHILLICRAAANPEDVDFRWRLLNETLTRDITSEGLESRLRLPATSESLGTYYCYVNNTLGESIPCEIDVTEKLGDDNIIVISAIVAAVIVLVIIICVVIIVICRRQRQAGKYPEGSKPPPTGHKDNGVPSSPDDDANKQTFYENLPFHGMQPPPNKPFLTSLGGGDMEYADVDYSTYNYGPIPYKAASVSKAEEKKAEQEAEMKGVPVRPPRKKQ